MLCKIKNRPSATNTETVDITGDDTLIQIYFTISGQITQ